MNTRCTGTLIWATCTEKDFLRTLWPYIYISSCLLTNSLFFMSFIINLGDLVLSHSICCLNSLSVNKINVHKKWCLFLLLFIYICCWYPTSSLQMSGTSWIHKCAISQRAMGLMSVYLAPVTAHHTSTKKWLPCHHVELLGFYNQRSRGH